MLDLRGSCARNTNGLLFVRSYAESSIETSAWAFASLSAGVRYLRLTLNFYGEICLYLSSSRKL